MLGYGIGKRQISKSAWDDYTDNWTSADKYGL